MPKTIPCAGNYGTMLHLDDSSPRAMVLMDDPWTPICSADGRLYCWRCAAKLPEYILKHCFHCTFYRATEPNNGFCTKENQPALNCAEGCEQYHPRSTRYF